MPLPLISFLKRHGYFGKAQIAEAHLHNATKLLSSGLYEETEDAITCLNSALQILPDWEKPLELKARALLHLNRFKEVVDLLHPFLPSLNNNNNTNLDGNGNGNGNNPSECLEKFNAKEKTSSKCFCIQYSSLLRRKSSSGKKTNTEGDYAYSRLEWRYLILGQACYHLGMMEDATILLRKGKKVALEASRRRSNDIRDDDFCCYRNAVIIDCNHNSIKRRDHTRNGAVKRDHDRNRTIRRDHNCKGKKCNHQNCGMRRSTNNREGIGGDDFCSNWNSMSDDELDTRRQQNVKKNGVRSHSHREKNHKLHVSACTTLSSDFNVINSMIANIKLLLRRRAAASIALESGLYSESVRHLTKLIEGHKGAAPPWFITDCYLHRAIAYQAMGRVVDAIADCNRTLTLNPKCTKALSVRASLHELVRSFTECLLDLQQLKMVFEANLRYRSARLGGAPSPSTQWTVEIQLNGSDSDMLSGLEYINNKIIAIRRRLSPGMCMLDARTILDMPEHCTMEDVEKAYLLISLKHSPDKASLFLDACLQDGYCRDLEIAREEAKASAVRLSKLIHKAYTKLLSTISEEIIEEQTELYNMRKARSWHSQYDERRHLEAQNMEETTTNGSKDRIGSTSLEMGDAKSDHVMEGLMASEHKEKIISESNERKIVDSEQENDKVREEDIDLSLVLEAFKGFKLFGDLSEDQYWLNNSFTGPWSLPHPQPLSVT